MARVPGSGDALASGRTSREIEAAILLVGRGHAPRVVISNLVGAGRAVAELQPLATAAGVALDVVDRPDGGPVQVVVRSR
jgi:hypothetical protein